jgi:GntR family transcriptional regulator
MSRINSPSKHLAATFSPLYLQIKALLLVSLESGEWQPGAAIPSELELASRFGVSQGTVRKAIDALSSESLLVRRQGKGTFVATHSEPLTQFRFLRLTALEGGQQSPERLLIDCRRIRASGEIGRMLDLKSGESLVVLRRILSFGGFPTVLDEISLPGTIFKGITAAKVSGYKGALYDLFETEFGVRMIRAEERIRAVAADTAAAELLNVDPGFPLLCVDRVSFTYGDRAVEFRRGLYRTEEHYYANKL